MRLRRATLADKDFFLRIRNDALAVRFSYSKQPISQEAHDRWWAQTHDELFVAEVRPIPRGLAGGFIEYADVPFEPVGTVRLSQVDDATCEIHLALDPAERGKGYAVGILREGREEARKAGYQHIIARVDAPNTASLRAFLRDGYAVTSSGTLLLEREIP